MNERILQLLTNLGNDENKVAQNLHLAEIKGFKWLPACCPINIYLTKELQEETIIALNDCPKPIFKFIIGFNFYNKYQNLISSEELQGATCKSIMNIFGNQSEVTLKLNDFNILMKKCKAELTK